MRRTGATIAIALAAVPCWGTVPADAEAAKNPRLVRVVAPADDGVARGGKARVVVLLGPRARAFRARLGRRDVTRAFRRGRGTRRVATLAGLRRGVNILHVTARDRAGGRDFESVRFLVTRRTTGLVRSRIAGRRGPVPRLTVRWRGEPDVVRVRLNGRRVERHASSERGRMRLALSASHGLRFGRNRLTVLAASRRGVHDVETHTLRVSRRLPLPAAGRDRRGVRGKPIRLDGRRSLPTRPARRLAFRWRIVRAPKGSRARLRGARSARPRLRPDRRGTYRVALTVRERGRGARSSTVATSDAVALAVREDHPPIGVPISARVDGTTRVNGEIYPYDGDVQLLVLDRATLEVRLNKSYSGNAGVDTLSKVLHGIDNGSIVLVTGRPGGTIGLSSDVYNRFLRAIRYVGGSYVSQKSLGSGRFSVLGVPALDAGPATGRRFAQGDQFSNDGLVLADDGLERSLEGALSGWLQLDTSGNYTFTFGDYVPFDVNVAGAPQGTIRVGEKVYSPQPLPAGRSGFHVVVLDPGSLKLIADETFATTGGDWEADGTGSLAMAQLLDPWAMTDATGRAISPALVLIHAVGSPRPTHPNWTKIARNIEALGGNVHVFNSLDGSGPYSLVGGAYAADSAVEQSHPLTRRSTRITGRLARDAQASWRPLVSDFAGGDYELLDIAYQDATDWPATDTAELRAAGAWIAGQLELPGSDVRDSYPNLNVDFDAKLAELEALSYPAGTDDFTSEDFAAVKAALVQEFDWVGEVRRLIANMKQPFEESGAHDYVSFEEVAENVRTAVDPPSKSAVSGHVFAIVADSLVFVGVLSPGVGEVVLVAVGTGMSLADEIANGPSGAPVASLDAVPVAELAGELEDALSAQLDGFDHVGDILVSDRGKLEATAGLAEGDLAWTGQETSTVAKAMTLSTKRWAYGRLLPRAYDLWRVTGVHGDAKALECRKPNKFRPAFYPFDGEPDSAQLAALVEFVELDGLRRPFAVHEAWALGTSGIMHDGGGSVAPASLTDPLFRDIASGGLGLEQPWFFARNFSLRDANCP